MMNKIESDGGASPDELKCFQPLGDYQWPSTSIDRGLKRVVARLRRHFKDDKSDEKVDSSQLIQPGRAMLDTMVSPPSIDPLIAELELTVAEWCETQADQSSRPAGHVCTIVLPPCDEDDLLRSWALNASLDVLEPPARDAFDQAVELPFGFETQTGIIVVPRLEQWFLRYDTGLVAVRDLLSRIDRSDRKWVIGCNSWAWQFLSKTCSIQAILPEPLVPAAFDAGRLRQWLGRLTERGDAINVRYRSASSGEDAFSSEPEQDKDQQNIMTNLAERSLGIPWVAWNQWRASLRMIDETSVFNADMPVKTDDQNGSKHQTLWVTDFRDFALPDHRDQQALLVLHALLIHGRLTWDEIHRTVPLARHSRVVSALITSGMVQRHDEWHACVPEAYPAIRDVLTVAGYRLDEL